MDVEKAPFLSAAKRVGISSDAAAALWNALSVTEPRSGLAPVAQALAPEAPVAAGSFNAASVAYYFGGFIVIGAMTFFMTLGWTNVGPAFVCVTAIVYGIVLGALGWLLYTRPGLRVPGGVLVTAAVCMAPLAIYGFQDWHHLWLDGDPGKYPAFYYLVHGSWIWMELGTIVASAIALRFVRFPLLTLPAAFALWFLSMDLTSAVFGHRGEVEQMQRLGLAFGVAMIALSIWIDRRGWRDYAVWTYIFGCLAFYFGLAILWDNELHEAIFAAICVFIVLLAVATQRRVLLVFAALGIATYLGHLAWDVFKDSIVFPFALTAVGLAIVGVGILYQRKEAQIRGALLGLLPGR